MAVRNSNSSRSGQVVVACWHSKLRQTITVSEAVRCLRVIILVCSYKHYTESTRYNLQQWQRVQ